VLTKCEGRGDAVLLVGADDSVEVSVGVDGGFLLEVDVKDSVRVVRSREGGMHVLVGVFCVELAILQIAPAAGRRVFRQSKRNASSAKSCVRSPLHTALHVTDSDVMTFIT